MEKNVRILLLLCGIISSLLYVGTDIAAALSWDSYSYAAQSISELMAFGAPSRPIMTASYIPYNVLVIAFGAGVFLAAGGKTALRVTGVLMVVYGLIGYVGLFIFPLPPPGTEAVNHAAVIRHEILTGITVACLLLIIGFGGAAEGKGFLLYSVTTILLVIGFGLWTGLDVPLREAHLPAPWMGIKERINVYAAMLWILVLAVRLGKRERVRF